MTPSYLYNELKLLAWTRSQYKPIFSFIPSKTLNDVIQHTPFTTQYQSRASSKTLLTLPKSWLVKWLNTRPLYSHPFEYLSYKYVCTISFISYVFRWSYRFLGCYWDLILLHLNCFGIIIRMLFRVGFRFQTRIISF